MWLTSGIHVLFRKQRVVANRHVGLWSSTAPAVGQALGKVTDPYGAVTTFQLDSYGRLLGKTYPDQSTETWTGNSRGLALTYTDQMGRVTSFAYATDRRDLTTLALPGGRTYAYTYNSFHRQTTATNPLGRVSTYGYDGSTGDLTSVRDGASG